VQLLDTYENDAKFWSDIISYTFRIIYRSHERTLINDEINAIQLKIRQKTEEMLWAQLR
jgi:phenylalanyl-tRNA synthetase beta subunit